LQEPLKALGADHVVLEGSDWAQSVATLTDGATIRLALNSIGGRSAIDQIKALGQGGLQVTFGGMVGDPIRFPTRYLIFNDLRLRGFWWDQWSQAAGTEEVQAVMDAVFSMLLNGSLQLPVAATYPLPSFAAAIEHAQQPRFGKILLQPAAAAVGG
jgi:NADPH:quinone reductase-like Zn-dependent oxidoreductase